MLFKPQLNSPLYNVGDYKLIAPSSYSAGIVLFVIWEFLVLLPTWLKKGDPQFVKQPFLYRGPYKQNKSLKSK